jgi:chromosome segregation ATPase
MVASSLFVAGVASCTAVWLSYQVAAHDKTVAALRANLEASQNELAVVRQTAEIAESQVRESTAKLAQLQKSSVGDTELVTSLKAELAAARQQLAVAETAIAETEARLSSEITAHAESKAKSKDVASVAPSSEQGASSASTSLVTETGSTSSTNAPKASDQASASEPRPITIEKIPDAAGGPKSATKPTNRRVTKTVKQPSTSLFNPFF